MARWQRTAVLVCLLTFVEKVFHWLTSYYIRDVSWIVGITLPSQSSPQFTLPTPPYHTNSSPSPPPPPIFDPSICCYMTSLHMMVLFSLCLHGRDQLLEALKAWGGGGQLVACSHVVGIWLLLQVAGSVANIVQNKQTNKMKMFSLCCVLVFIHKIPQKVV